jgi:hypothetical protein
LPEVEVSAFLKVMKERFSIFNEAVNGKSHMVRLVSHPYKTSDPACKHVQIPTHNFGPDGFSPLVIRRALDKFGVTVEDFNEAYTELKDIETKRPV